MNIQINHLFFWAILLLSSYSYGQSKSSIDIYQDIEKLKSPYRVLYIAAHPDDENTRLISYLTKEVKAQTAYLSLTRGAGGQNLIGNEKGDLLGVLRTEELLSARKIDGGNQFFTRALDFGYSKSSDESFEIWGKQLILSDVVYIIRYFKPHIIINRFPTNEYSGHGHHLASALLSNEAFDIAGNKEMFPEQTEQPWQPGTIYLNSSTWWDKTLTERAKNDISISEVNVGDYNKMLGYSCNELSAFSRSEHKSQGFGTAPIKGEQLEYLEYIKGEFEPGNLLTENLLDSIDKKWLVLAPLFDSILNHFDFLNPSASVGRLIYLKGQAINLDPSNNRFQNKLAQIDMLILNCLGVSAELKARKEWALRGESLIIEVEAINRSSKKVNLKEINIGGQTYSWNRPLEYNSTFKDTISLLLSNQEEYTTPYWLKKASANRYNCDQIDLKTPGIQIRKAEFIFEVDNQFVSVPIELSYKWTDRVKGGLSIPMAVLPGVNLEFDKGIYFVKDNKINGNVILKSRNNTNTLGTLFIEGDESLSMQFKSNLNIISGQTITIPFTTPFNADSIKNFNISARFVTGTDTFSTDLKEIKYDHIEDQFVLVPAKAKIVPGNFSQLNRRVAYVEGPDNEMIEYLKESGCAISIFKVEDLINQRLKEFDVLLFGIRSLNIDPSWNDHSEQIKEYIKNGGLVIVMYQTQGRDAIDVKFSPYSFEISRNRVTDEKAKTNIYRPDHSILNYPFKMNKNDFEGWNQERGLYFADKWSDDFQTVLSWHDKEELDQFGSVIIGNYGKGAFIYTGISFFRHIPYGVPGSYKLFMNLLSYKNK